MNDLVIEYLQQVLMRIQLQLIPIGDEQHYEDAVVWNTALKAIRTEVEYLIRTRELSITTLE